MNTIRMAALREAMRQVVRIMNPVPAPSWFMRVVELKALSLRKVGARIVITVRQYHYSDGGAHPLCV